VVKIGGLIALGATEEQACLAQNPPVNLESFRTARKRNPEFELPIKKAQADFLARALPTIANGGEVEEWVSGGKVVWRVKPWTGLAWILERRHKPQFNRTDTHAVTDEKGAPFLTDEDMKELSKTAKEMIARGAFGFGARSLATDAVPTSTASPSVSAVNRRLKKTLPN